MVKTIVISGARSNVGKTSLARRVQSLLPRAVRIKIGHHTAATERDDDGFYYTIGTPFSAIVRDHESAGFLIAESNSVLTELQPDCCIYLGADDSKPSAALASRGAHICRGASCSPGTVSTLGARLGVDPSLVKKIAWYAGARPRTATALILAGGRSSRMGADKALLMFKGKPAVRWLHDGLSPYFDDVIVSIAMPDARYKGFRVCVDESPDSGPLGGIAAAMKESVRDVVFVLSCDTPCVNMTLVWHMLALSEDFDAIAPSFGRRPPEPLFAVYRNAVAARAERLVREGRLRVANLFDDCRAFVVGQSDESWLMNLNTPSDHERFLASGQIPGVVFSHANEQGVPNASR